MKATIIVYKTVRANIRSCQQGEYVMANEEKIKALDAAIAKLEKDFGKGTVMKLGDPKAQVAVETIPTGLHLPLSVLDTPIHTQSAWKYLLPVIPYLHQILVLELP